jgi:predicted nucleotidyltransferase
MTADLDRILADLKSVTGKIHQKYKATIVGVFGSYVRGEQKEGSDVDVLVRFHEGATLLDLVGLADFLEEQLGVQVDVVSERAVRPELKDQILKEVVVV